MRTILLAVLAPFVLAGCRPGPLEPRAAQTPLATAQAATSGPSAPAEPKPKVGPVICVDPGHTSENGPGAVSADGTREVVVNWQMAQLLRDELVRRGARVVLTKRELAQKVTNRRRAEIANEARAAVCMRLHCDANGGRGFAVYYPAEAGRVDGRSGPPEAVRTASRKAGQALVDALAKRLDGELHNGGLRTDRQTAVGAKQGALTGSVYSEVPVVTVEMVDLTHRADVAWLKSAEHRRALANALADGALAFAGEGR